MFTGFSIASLGLKMIGFGKWLLDLIPKIIKWAIDNPWRAACLFLALWMVFIQVRTIPAKDREIAVQSGAKDILAERYVAERNAFNEFIIKVALAREVAAELDRQNAKRVKDEFEKKLSEIEDENTNLRDANRSLITDRLRGVGVSTASVSLGSGGTANLPVISFMPGGIVPATGAAIVSESDALICADNHSQLLGLIKAWNAASMIDVNGNPD